MADLKPANSPQDESAVADLRGKTWPTISKPADLTHSSISQSAVTLHRVAAFCFTRYSLNSPYLGDQRVHVVPFDQEMLRPLGLTLPVGPAKITMLLPIMWPLLVWPCSLVIETLPPGDMLTLVGLPS
jgi:hypothetical protein